MIKRIYLLMLLALSPMSFAKNVTLVVDEVPVAQVLQSLADLEQKNIVISPDVQGVISLQLRSLPWRLALQTVVNSAGLALSQESGVFYVRSQRWREEERARAAAEKERRQQKLPLKSLSIVLDHADAGELAKAGGSLLGARGTLLAHGPQDCR